MRESVICACVDAENRPRRDCDLGCGGTGVLCARCLDKPGRWRDDRCPDCDGYPAADVSAAPSPEAERLAFAWSVQMA